MVVRYVLALWEMGIDESVASAISDKSRIEIMNLLKEKSALPTAKIAVSLGKHRSTISRHLSKLMEAGLVTRTETVEGHFLYTLTERGRLVFGEIAKGEGQPLIEVPIHPPGLFLRLRMAFKKSLLVYSASLIPALIGVWGLFVRASALSKIVWLFFWLVFAFGLVGVARWLEK